VSTTMVCWMMLACWAHRAVDSSKGAVENLQFELRAAGPRRLAAGACGRLRRRRWGLSWTSGMRSASTSSSSANTGRRG